MIRFRHSTGKAAGYRCILNEILSKANVNAKFDTGADYTIVTANALSLSRRQIELLNTFIKEKNYTKKSFISASGHIMDGFLSRSNNVIFDKTIVAAFFYYIILDDSIRPIVLLGDDFISCCNFSHNFNGDIIVSAFNSAAYEDRYRGNKFNTISVLDVLYDQYGLI